MSISDSPVFPTTIQERYPGLRSREHALLALDMGPTESPWPRRCAAPRPEQSTR